MDRQDVECVKGVYRLVETRVTLTSIVYAYREGHRAETIAQAFGLRHEQVEGALAFYLAHQAEVDDAIRQEEALQESLRLALQRRHPHLYQKLVEARRTSSAAP